MEKASNVDTLEKKQPIGFVEWIWELPPTEKRVLSWGELIYLHEKYLRDFSKKWK